MARRLAVSVVVTIILIAAGAIALHIPRTISIFLVAAFIAFGAAPLVQRLERWMPRGAAIALVYLVLMGALVLLALVIVPITYAQLSVLVGHTSDYVIASQVGVAHLEAFVRERLGDRVALPTFTQLQVDVGERVGTMFSLTLGSIGTILFGAFNMVLIGASSLILSVFLLSRGREVRGGVLALLPVSRREKTNALLVEVASIFGHFVAGQLALCAIVGAAVWATLGPAHFAFALLVAVVAEPRLGPVLSVVVVFLASLNVFGGYVVTGRMLAMFKPRPAAAGDGKTPANDPLTIRLTDDWTP